MRCTKCGAENAVGKKFCSQCGSGLPSRCPKCGTENPLASRFCGDCGAALVGNAELAATRSSQIGSIPPDIRVVPEQPDVLATDGERKTVTALFADIKGSTELEQDLDPEEARAIIDPALKIMIEAVRRYDGYIVQSTGDGIFALFGAPVAHEDHPQRALYAALRMQEELKRYAARLRVAGSLPIEARVGVNTGEVVVRSITTGEGHTEYTPIGHTANLASRMQALAPTGSIAISEQTRKFVEGYFQLKSLGPTKVKGVIEPVIVYEVTGLGPLRTRLQQAAGRGFTKFVGRQLEMDAIKAAAERAKAGHGQIVAAMAEAGVGKSRLMFEFKATGAAGWMVLEAFSVSHGKPSSYLPVVDLLHSYFKIALQDDQRTRREKIAGRIAILDRTLDSAIPYLYSLLGIAEASDPLAQMDGQIKKRRTLDAIKRILLRESLDQPLIVIFEDLHWIDAETQALLNLLADSIATARVLLLVNYRPEYTHSWGGKTYYTQLRLDALGGESADEMLGSILGEGKDLIPLKQLIVDRTEGNPFFMEEIVQALFEERALVRNGAVKLAKSMSEVKVPATVQAVLSSRIDRLPPAEKDLLQTAAVIGKEFSLQLAAEVAGIPELERMLADLQTAEFIYERPAAGDVEYTFKHALTQQVAYEAILHERRKVLHERVGSAIETLYAASIDDHLSALAHHYTRAANAEKAVKYLRMAAIQASKRSARYEAKGLLVQARSLVLALPASRERLEAELAVETELGVVMIATKGWGAPEGEQSLLRAQQLCEELGDRNQLIVVLINLSQSCIQQCRMREAREYAERCVALAEQQGDTGLLLMGRNTLGEVLARCGELRAAREHMRGALELFDSRQHAHLASVFGVDPRVMLSLFLAPVEQLMGFWDRAREETEAGLRQARAQSERHGVNLRVALINASTLARLAGDSSAAREFAEELLSIGREGFALGLLGAALLNLGRSEEAILVLNEGFQRYRATGGRASQERWLLPLAEAYARQGRTDEALRMVSDMLDTARQTGHLMYEPMLLQARGEFLLEGSSPDRRGAEAALRQAIEAARWQEAKSSELRATTSLARLLAQEGHRDEAHAMLAEIYNWFTEGFDTADLKDAKALLVELGG
jgi:class 3 adenylate cyclase/tetratricopeptide (TPR) repeat protein